MRKNLHPYKYQWEVDEYLAKLEADHDEAIKNFYARERRQSMFLSGWDYFRAFAFGAIASCVVVSVIYTVYQLVEGLLSHLIGR